MQRFYKIDCRNSKKMAKRFLYFVSISLLFIFFGCKKQSLTGADQLYGNWKTSYGDTIRFSKQGHKDVITYDMSMNPTMPLRTTKEYSFENNRFGIKDGMAGPVNFRYFDTFTWVSPGEQFQVLGMEWFMFISSSTTVFTFTKID
jgi:hypothetical protein